MARGHQEAETGSGGAELPKGAFVSMSPEYLSLCFLHAVLALTIVSIPGCSEPFTPSEHESSVERKTEPHVRIREETDQRGPERAGGTPSAGHERVPNIVGAFYGRRNGQVVTVSLSRIAANVESLACLKGFSHLQELNLSYTQITDAELRHIAGLIKMRALDIEFTQVTSGGLAHLARMTQLEELKLSSTRVSDAGLAHLASMTALRKLYLWDIRITDTGLAHLAGLTEMKELQIGNTDITDDGLASSFAIQAAARRHSCS